METKTIIDIKKLKDSISQNFEEYKNHLKNYYPDLNGEQLSTESEYSVKEIIVSIKDILTDITYLVSSHNIFIKISTHTERNNLHIQLNNLNAFLQKKQQSQIIQTLEQLKIIIRSFNISKYKERHFEFMNEIDNLRKTAMSLEEEIISIKNNFQESENLLNEIKNNKTTFDENLEELETKKNDLEKEYKEFKTVHNELKELTNIATKNEEIISEKLKSAKENEETINNFFEIINAREKQLEQQNTATEKYNETLEKYTEERQKILAEAQYLIEESKKSLGYSNATGLSDAFSNQKKDANTKTKTIGWLISAGIFICATITLGLLLVMGDKTDSISIIVGRLSMIPFTLLSALFCANQYVKQKNIIEDYAYKTVLAQSIVAFSDALQKNDTGKYAEYISTVIKEIHQDPLRKRAKEKDEITIKDSAGLFNKIVELIKNIK